MDTPQIQRIRVRQILQHVIESWERNHGRSNCPCIHDYYWATPEHLANDVARGKRFIEPGVCGSETQLVRALRQGLDSIPHIPVVGPYLKERDSRDC